MNYYFSYETYLFFISKHWEWRTLRKLERIVFLGGFRTHRPKSLVVVEDHSLLILSSFELCLLIFCGCKKPCRTIKALGWKRVNDLSYEINIIIIFFFLFPHHSPWISKDLIALFYGKCNQFDSICIGIWRISCSLLR